MELKQGDRVKIKPSAELPLKWKNKELTGTIHCIRPDLPLPIGVIVDNAEGQGHNLHSSGEPITSQNGWWFKPSDLTLLPTPSQDTLIRDALNTARDSLFSSCNIARDGRLETAKACIQHDLRVLGDSIRTALSTPEPPTSNPLNLTRNEAIWLNAVCFRGNIITQDELHQIYLPLPKDGTDWIAIQYDLFKKHLFHDLANTPKYPPPFLPAPPEKNFLITASTSVVAPSEEAAEEKVLVMFRESGLELSLDNIKEDEPNDEDGG